MEWTKTKLKHLIYQVNGACIEVHKALGPGLLESVYHRCLENEFLKREIIFESEMHVPIHYNDIKIDSNLRCDFFIEKILVLEIKSIESLLPIHQAQLLTYMKLLKSPKGLLVNFNVQNIYSQGQKTMVNNLFRKMPN